MKSPAQTRPGRWIAAGSAILLLAGCGGQGDTRTIISETCVRDGGTETVCACLARESVARLDDDALDAVVFGALGEDAEADQVLAEMGEGGQVRFRTGITQVLQACNAEDYVSANEPAAASPD